MQNSQAYVAKLPGRQLLDPAKFDTGDKASRTHAWWSGSGNDFGCAPTGGHNLDLSIGIAKGFATLGAFGYEGRFDYSAIGSVVNLAARLCDEAGAGEIGAPEAPVLDQVADGGAAVTLRRQGVELAGAAIGAVAGDDLQRLELPRDHVGHALALRR